MKFYYPGREPILNETSAAFLYEDSWDDWFTFQTTFNLVVIDSIGNKHYLGTVKIGEIGRANGKANIPSEFEELPDKFFSLGQNESYYEALVALPIDDRVQVGKSLRDIAIDLKLFQKFKYEFITQQSLMRFISESTIKERFNKIWSGTAKLTKYKFSYSSPSDSDMGTPYSLDFEVIPKSLPPSNIHVLIGRNGVGKTNCLNKMVNAIMNSSENKFGRFVFDDASDSCREFSGVVNVSFSAFDSNPVIKPSDNAKVRYYYVGLIKESEISITKNPSEIGAEFSKSFEQCLNGPRQTRWIDAVKRLESDPIFKDSKISEILSPSDALKIFSRFSSGHKIILLIITKLVELVDERTLILLDEPEGHLHPPLLAAFLRALSDLLITRNGVAIIATHSPVVLQEVPLNCVSIIDRFGKETRIRRPEMETFGENVGILTREIFGLEVTNSGFHQLLEVQSQNSSNYEDALSKFSGHLGAEAKSILRGMIARKNRDE